MIRADWECHRRGSDDDRSSSSSLAPGPAHAENVVVVNAEALDDLDLEVRRERIQQLGLGARVTPEVERPQNSARRPRCAQSVQEDESLTRHPRNLLEGC